MKTLVAIIFASAAMISTAFAGEVQGVIKAVHSDTATIELESGESFKMAQGLDAEDLDAGQTVKITFDDKTHEATEISGVE